MVGTRLLPILRTEMQPYRICELTELVEPDLRRVMVGYTSMQKYQVSRQESETETIIRLELVDLPAPHIRHFGEDLTADDLVHYREMLPAGYCLGACTGEELVGFAIADARTWNRTLWIWELHVASTWQGRGIGRRLVDVLAEKAGAAGLRTLLVETQNTNVPAIRFYRRTGFEIEGIDLSYYTNYDVNDFEVAIFMKRKLPQPPVQPVV